MSNDFPVVEIDYKDLVKELEEFDKEMPNVARKLMRAVNREVKKQIKKESRSRGYLAHKETKWGDSGYQKNLFSYANKDYTGKIMMGKNAFQYTFIEYGANHKTITYKLNGKMVTRQAYSIPANPLIRPIAQGIWGTTKATEIMETELQKIMNKQFKQ